MTTSLDCNYTRVIDGKLFTACEVEVTSRQELRAVGLPGPVDCVTLHVWSWSNLPISVYFSDLPLAIQGAINGGQTLFIALVDLGAEYTNELRLQGWEIPGH